MAFDDETRSNEPRGQMYELTLQGGGVTMKRTVEEAVALQILAAVMGGPIPRPSQRVVASSSGETPRPTPEFLGRGVSVREYMEEFEPKRNVDKILAIAAYLSDIREQDTFSTEQVKKEFRNAKEPLPGNFGRDFRWAIANAWVAPADDPDEYYVTTRGRAALDGKFSDEIKKGTGVDRTARRRRTKKKGEDS